MRRTPTKVQRERLLAANGWMCCVCKAFGVGLELHHDAHHRPSHYPSRHLELGAAEIRRHKQEWETFIQEARLSRPRLLATVSGYGTSECIHSAKVVYQWTSGKIAFERIYHQLLSGNIEDWTTDIVEECVRFGQRIPLMILNEPVDVAHCPCCRKGLSNVIDRGYALRLAAPNWERDSMGSIYVNPDQPSLAVHFALEDREVFSGHLHLCRGTHLHFTCDDYDESRPVKLRPSVRRQVTQLIENLLRDWRPARVFIGTGDHDKPHLIKDLRLPRCWENSGRRDLKR